jgi:hypothetical protein
MSYGISVTLDMPFAGARAKLGEETAAGALGPQVMVTLTGRPGIKPVPGPAGRRLTSALAALSQ